MQYLPKLRTASLVAAALFALAAYGGASAQTIGGPGGTCRSSGFNGTGGSVNCRVSATTQLVPNNTIYVALASPITGSAQCQGRTPSGYATTGAMATVPNTGGSGCEFEVTTGTVPAGDPVGDIMLSTATVTNGAALQFATEVCGDPSCVTNGGVLTTQTVSANVSVGGNQLYCPGGSGYGNNFPYSGGYGQFCGNGCGSGLTSYYYGNQSCNSSPYSCGATTCAGYTYCNGAEIPTGTYCSTGTSYTYCNGAEVPAGTYCNTTSGYTTCPNGQQVPYSTLCTSLTTGLTASYQTGWNLVAGPPGTVAPGSTGPLYYFAPGSSSYQTLAPGQTMQPGVGYWAYFPTGTTVSLAANSGGSATVNLPAGQFITIGNPSDGLATVSGPVGLTVLVYNPSTQTYSQTTELQPGQGGWAALPQGGTITISGTGSTGYGGPPPPPPPLP